MFIEALVRPGRAIERTFEVVGQERGDCQQSISRVLPVSAHRFDPALFQPIDRQAFNRFQPRRNGPLLGSGDEATLFQCRFDIVAGQANQVDAPLVLRLREPCEAHRIQIGPIGEQVVGDVGYERTPPLRRKKLMADVHGSAPKPVGVALQRVVALGD